MASIQPRGECSQGQVERRSLEDGAARMNHLRRARRGRRRRHARRTRPTGGHPARAAVMLPADRRHGHLLRERTPAGAVRRVGAVLRLEPPGQRPAPPAKPAPERPRIPEPKREPTWIEISLVDEAGDAVAEEAVLIVDPSGARQTLTTDEHGVARLGGIEPGICDVSFPRIDGREWARFGERFPEGSDALEKVHLAQADECMSRIAHAYRFRSPGTLYLHHATRSSAGCGGTLTPD
jgi:hypothetical protein